MGGAVSDGGCDTSLTVTVIVSESVSAPSETTTSKVYDPGPSPSEVVQVKSPPAVMAAPAGTVPPRLKVRVCAGTSESVAVAVKVSGDPLSTLFAPIGSRIGATLTSFTVTVIVSESVSAPSETITSMLQEPCSSVGDQVKSPPAVIAAPAGAVVPRLKLRVCAGTSESVAVAVKVSGDPSSTLFAPIGSRIGATLASFTVTVIVSASVSSPSETITSLLQEP